MCVTFLSLGGGESESALLLASNRDEAFQRPSESATWAGDLLYGPHPGRSLFLGWME